MNYSHQELVEWDKTYLWHPFTHMKQYLMKEPLIIVRGEGVRVQDSLGRWYYDGTASIWLNVHGHRVAKLDEAIKEQLNQIAHSTLLGMSNLPATVLAKRLIEIAPKGLKRVFYADNGAGAVEAAIKIAVQYWANLGKGTKKLILGFENNYHGDTLGAVGVSPDELFHWAFTSLLPDHPRVPYPYPYRSKTDDPLRESLDAAEKTLQERADEIAAVIVEPIEGAGGIIVPPDGFLSKLSKLCSRYEVLLIVDEVATGFGRTGFMFACNKENVSPDLMCLGKGISGGYLPVAATLTTEKIFEAFLSDDFKKSFFHGHSYAGNALGAAVSIVNIDLLEKLIPTLPEKAEALSKMLAPIAEEPFVGEIRQAGFMIGIEIVRDRKQKTPFSYESQAGWLVANKARELGLLVRPIGNVLIFMPPLTATNLELEQMTHILLKSFYLTRDDLSKL
ncbi:MAG: adenosylmethionine--8-amino-7-oxononanoate transaminase [Pyrinomonadaceae bacterium]|nr:adenosylmethionine--8-amino-7-oxononanoate transaminase [Pyrinomonadaceae bacterium]MCX7640028.1 adenosylmethionine--8-amino-7-oxononanoate transaminase [Pyrinomonadaceae bacterium]MDW8304200.1 adenosylmethionine--8-amino-7-oxononanoate transaminase [Acidobacteriota bacterium]